MVMFLRRGSRELEALDVGAATRSLEIELVERDRAQGVRPLAEEEEKGIGGRRENVKAPLGREALARIENDASEARRRVRRRGRPP